MSVVLDRIKLGENLAESGFDEIFPAVLLMGNQVWDGEGLVAFGEEDATTSGSRFREIPLLYIKLVLQFLAPKITAKFFSFRSPALAMSKKWHTAS